MTGKFSRLLKAVQHKEYPIALIASLPRNDPAMAKAALEGGADVIKLHINLQHRASGTKIGSLDEEKPALEAILKLCDDKPVGIVPGNRETANQAEMVKLAEMGFDFLSLYLHNAPVGLLPPSDQLERMLAFSNSDSSELANSLEDLDVQVCELSIMEPDTYGQELTYLDLVHYASFRRRTHLPLVVPSQHRIPVEALPELSHLGIDAVMLGTINCGNTLDSWMETFKTFNQARKLI